jgi:hypothetical protein
MPHWIAYPRPYRFELSSWWLNCNWRFYKNISKVLYTMERCASKNLFRKCTKCSPRGGKIQKISRGESPRLPPLLLHTIVWSLFVDCSLPTDNFLKKPQASNECWWAFGMVVYVNVMWWFKFQSFCKQINMNYCNKQFYFVTFGENWKLWIKSANANSDTRRAIRKLGAQKSGNFLSRLRNLQTFQSGVSQIIYLNLSFLVHTKCQKKIVSEHFFSFVMNHAHFSF